MSNWSGAVALSAVALSVAIVLVGYNYSKAESKKGISDPIVMCFAVSSNLHEMEVCERLMKDKQNVK